MLYTRFILPALFFTFSIIGMEQKISPFPIQALPQELVPVILSNIDTINTASAFSRTCNHFSTTYPTEKILEKIIPHRVWVRSLSPTQHTKVLVHYSHKENEDEDNGINMISDMMKAENKYLEKIRKKVLEFFYWLQGSRFTPMLHCPRCTKNIYGGHILNVKKKPHLAAFSKKNYQALNVLLLNEVNPEKTNLCNSENQTLLMLAAQSGHLLITKLLLDLKCIKNIQDRSGNTALHYGCEKNYITLSTMLIQYKCNPNIKNHSLRTPLHVAVKFSDLIIAKQLIENDADITIKDLWGKTAFDYVRGEKKQELLLCYANKTKKNTRSSNKRKSDDNSKPQPKRQKTR